MTDGQTDGHTAIAKRRAGEDHLEVVGCLRQRQHVVSGMRALLISAKKTAERLAASTVDVDHDVVLKTP